VNRWNDKQIETPRTGSSKPDGKLNRQIPNSLFQDDRGRIWISTNAGVGYLENEGFVSVSGVPGGYVHGIAEDNSGSLWIANQKLGLFRFSARSISVMVRSAHRSEPLARLVNRFQPLDERPCGHADQQERATLRCGSLADTRQRLY